MNNIISGKAHLTFSNRIKAEKYLKEISLRDNIPIKRLLNIREIREVLISCNSDKKQKGKRLIAVLEFLRYPELTKCKQKYKKMANYYFEDGNISFVFQENGDYEIRINQPEK